MKRLVAGVVGIGLVAGATVFALDTHSSALEATDLSNLRESLQAIKPPKIEDPQWLKQEKAEIAAAAAVHGTASQVGRIITYDVATRGAVTGNLAEFRTQANQTLNDSRGWARMGVSFREVPSGGEFTLVLAEASQVATFAGCSADYSCRSGRYVLINQDRWLGATSAWNAGGGSLRDYRHMVVNHETGHWLGHGHEYCKAAGTPAPVMQQQSISLQGCTFNPWPLASELWIGS